MKDDYFKVSVDSLHPHEAIGVSSSVFPFDSRDADDRARAWSEASDAADAARRIEGRTRTVRIVRYSRDVAP